MKSQLLLCIAGLSIIYSVLGCKDSVGPEMSAAYETDVYGTFRGIDGTCAQANAVLGYVCFDTSSYVHISKADSRYVFKFQGRVISNGNLNLSVEETGTVRVWVGHLSAGAEGNLVGRDIYDIQITFIPDIPVRDSLHVVRSLFVDNPGRSDGLSFDGDGLKIYVGQDVYLLVKGWHTLRNPC